jgi:hypothetical protein
MANNRKNSRRNRRNTMRKNRKNSRRNNNMSMRRRRNNINMMGGEYSMPSPVNDMSMKGPMDMSLSQGQQFASFHANQHGGALSGGPYPGVVTEEALISPTMAVAARTAPLNAALTEIRGMTDQAGGRRKRRTRNRSTRSRKGRKNSRKGRKNSRKGRKNSRKGRKNNMSMRRRRNNMMGGAVLSPAATSAPGLLLPSGLEAKAVSGMNAEWKLAENARAFAPGL